MEDEDDRIRVHLLQLERSQPEKRISVILEAASQLRVELRGSAGDLPVLAEQVEVVPGGAGRDAGVKERGDAQDLLDVVLLELLVLLLLPEFLVERDRKRPLALADRTSAGNENCRNGKLWIFRFFL